MGSEKNAPRDLMVPCALNILEQLSDAYGTPVDDTINCPLTYLHSRHERSISCPILQVKKLRLQEPEVPMLVASFYPLRPAPASLIWPRAPFPASIRGLEGKVCRRREREWGEGQTMRRRGIGTAGRYGTRRA